MTRSVQINSHIAVKALMGNGLQVEDLPKMVLSLLRIVGERIGAVTDIGICHIMM